jgi:hypothetical protein
VAAGFEAFDNDADEYSKEDRHDVVAQSVRDEREQRRQG